MTMNKHLLPPPRPRPEMTSVEGRNLDIEAVAEFLCAAADYQDVVADAVDERTRQYCGLGDPGATGPGGILTEHEWRRDRLLDSLAWMLRVDGDALVGGLAS